MIESISVANGTATITWDSAAGQTYRVQYKGSLTDTNWTDVAPDVPATGPLTSVTNVVGNAEGRFYRVMQVH